MTPGTFIFLYFFKSLVRDLGMKGVCLAKDYHIYGVSVGKKDWTYLSTWVCWSIVRYDGDILKN